MLKDFNDVLVAGKSIIDIPTQNIDIFCMEMELNIQSTIESQYKSMEKYIKTVRNDLIKSDIARILATRWGKEPSEVREFLRVAGKIDTDEIMSEFKDVYQCINEMEDRVFKQTGITTGLPTFDKSIGGLNLSDVFFVAARPSSGKTFLAIEMALHMAIKEKLNVLFFSLEMPAGAIYLRIVANILQCSLFELREKIRKKEIDYSLIVSKINKYLKIIDTPALTMQDIEERIKLANTTNVFNGNVNVVIIDYIQLVSGMSEFTDFEKNVTGLNPMARRNNVLLIPLSQMARSVKSWDEPDISNMKGGGSLEAVGNVILMLWKESENPALTEIDRQELIDSGKDNVVRAKIGKARDGFEQRYFSLYADKKKSSFKECYES